ncbi:MAG: alpha,alpha-trehalose-phosphate synthase (UDP-forming) [Tistlia sp.]|uniref:alpha,alpha-trehalose-phosphate synthase (UDP-forming) n=1 Tax=Tistlia sp. TaxID=3057121 RepID=UPI0034A4A32E
MSRLVVVSNRVSAPRQGRTGGEGGLAVGILAALRERGGLWFGWSGKITELGGKLESFDAGRITYATLDLTARDYEEYYSGFANRSLWPLFHYRLDLADFTRRYLAGYQRVNALFASKLLPGLQADDQIWIHDYHLIPLADQLRQAGCKQKIGFFLHIPWPAPEVLVALPNHRSLVNSLCAYDLVGFQTETDRQAFIDYVLRDAGGTAIDETTVELNGRRVKTGAYPISIDTGNLAKVAEEAANTRHTERLRASVRDRDLIVGVDRLDYSKGLVARVEAFEHLLKAYPANRGRAVFLQIAPPSRSDVPEYQQIRGELESACGRVNAAYADFDWTPIRYLNKGFSRRLLTGFFRVSSIGLVTPLRDGMNLVAKEYVACQDPDEPGVLVLSRFAGAARELEAALIVNPYDTEGVAEALQSALAMSRDERRERWRSMYDYLVRHDIDGWRESFLKALSDA